MKDFAEDCFLGGGGRQKASLCADWGLIFEAKETGDVCAQATKTKPFDAERKGTTSYPPPPELTVWRDQCRLICADNVSWA